MTERKKRRTAEERVAEIDAKIEAHKKNIAVLEEKRKSILNPKPKKPRLTVESIVKQAKKNGFSLKEIAEKLSIEEE